MVIENSKDLIQDYPTVDSDHTEPFEGLVETYYQMKGFITSSNKWFWYFESGKNFPAFVKPNHDLI